MELYLETMNKLHRIIEMSDPSAPVILLGDFNTSLPDSVLLEPNWYKQKPFNN